MAVANYHDNHGSYPPAYLTGPDGRPWHSWRVLLLPYLEEGELHRQYDFSEPWDGPNNRRLAGRMPRTYAFHVRTRPDNPITNYLAVVGEETIWRGGKGAASAEVKDDPGTTILVVENHGADVHWMEPRDLSLADMDLRLNTPGGISSPYRDPAVVMLDGSLHRLQPNLSPALLRALLTVRGGERLQAAGYGAWTLLPDGRQRPLRRP